MASFILFKGFNTTDAVNTISLLCGFLTIFTGVYLLNLSRDDPDGRDNMMGGRDTEYDVDGIPTDGMAASLTRRSMQSRRSIDAHRRSGSGSLYGGSIARRSGDRDREALMHHYDLESANGDRFGLAHLTEEPDSDDEHKRPSFGERQINGSPTIGKIRSNRTR